MKRIIWACLCLALVLVCRSPAQAEEKMLVVLGRAEDAVSFSESWNPAEDAEVLILQKASEKARKAADQALGPAGFGEITYAGLPAVSERKLSEKVLEKNWATQSALSKVASLIRRCEPQCIVFYSENGILHGFLRDYARRCALSAWDPDVRFAKQKEDEYIWQTGRILDWKSGAEEIPVYPDLRMDLLAKYGEKTEPAFEDMPETDEEGFLRAGQYTASVPEEGKWAYITQNLRIVITRHEIKGLAWFEADIRRKADGDTLHIVSSPNGREMNPARLAADSRTVLAVNADYYRYRINYKMLVGLIVRDHAVVRDFHQTTSGTSLPPLDTLMLNEDGMFQVDRAGVMDGEKALAAGARDVLSFGPILVKGSRIRMLLPKYRAKLEPRTAVGMLEPNHYLVIVAEGRLKTSKGISLNELGKLFYLRGCTEAINLDGGHTSALFFLGERLNKIGNLTGDGTSAPRNMSELLGIGTFSSPEDVQ